METKEQKKKNKIKIGKILYRIVVAILLLILVMLCMNSVKMKKEDDKYKMQVKSTLRTGPIQRNLRNKETIKIKDAEITKLAEYDITGVVIGEEFFYFGGGANRISNRDLTLCWGPIISEKYFDDVKTIYGINDRMATINFSGDIAKDYGDSAINFVSNNHIIPLNSTVKNKLRKVKKGDTVQILGWLVDCKGDGWNWGPSSLVRNDSGCEIILVKYLSIIK